LGARENPFFSQANYYESTACKFCGDDARRVVCSQDSCDHAFCVKERGVCYECGLEKLGIYVATPSGPSIKDREITKEEYDNDNSFDMAARLIEDNG
jgi:hypothetical protein